MEMFVLRARRITEHSLFKDRELFRNTRRGNVHIKPNPDTDPDAAPHLFVQELPAEELLESLAARIRPLLLDSESLFYAKVLNALGRLVAASDIAEVAEPISWWKKEWRKHYSPNGESGMAYSVITEQGPVTDRKLMELWLYGDLIHSDDIAGDALGLGIELRYQAAAGIVVRIAELVERTLHLILILVDDGALTVNPEVFTQRVHVGTTVIERPILARFAETGTVAPMSLENLDPAVWREVSELPEALAGDSPSTS
ncbi:hypothetical protein [Nocardia sp. NPDC052112]|uniref:hypothetical protein n=1 Tax=Nocardia sp. NPDC052112 TaxID=3155646 RepID=UPI003432DD49